MSPPTTTTTTTTTSCTHDEASRREHQKTVASGTEQTRSEKRRMIKANVGHAPWTASAAKAGKGRKNKSTTMAGLGFGRGKCGRLVQKGRVVFGELRSKRGYHGMWSVK